MHRPSLSVEEVEDAALDDLFQRGIRRRVYLAPFVFLAAMTVLALDPAPWRRALVAVALTLALGRLLVEAVRVRADGFRRTRLKSLLPVPATLLLLAVTASGGVDSPLLLLLPVVTVFVCLFLRPSYGLIFATAASLWVWVMAAIAANEWVPTLMPQFFGGGARAPGTLGLLFTRATFATVALFWAAGIGWVMRGAFQSAIARALQARDEVLRSHEESTQTLTTLVAEIAHELKNPLASVKGLSALVARTATGKELERLDVLRHEADRMGEILESFLNFSRPLVPLEVASLHLHEVVQQVLALCEGSTHERGITFRLDANLDATTQGDARKLKQIILNLVQNALDVTHEGGTIDLVISHDAKGARVLVMDRGPGVAQPERVFEAGVTTKANGHGLGLTIARLLARQHGGDVILKPREGGGTLAELSLPIKAPS